MNSTMDIGQYLKEQGEMLIAPMGSSMLPLLKGDDCQVILEYPESPLRKYDVVMYRAENGKLILHRIIKVLPSSYILCGDNTYCCETGIVREQILGVMTGFYRKNTCISCNQTGYRLYVRIWWFLYPLRRIAVCIRRSLHRFAGRTGND